MASPGDRIGERYTLVAEIGAGGMGVVFRAKDERLEREVAVKLLPGSALQDPAGRARLIREARATAQLVHPGIVHVYDVGDLPDGGAFLVMELVAGQNLRDLVDGDASLARRVAWVVDIARALAHAHAAGIVHRDVKPDNVFVRPDGRPVLLDFGLAKPIPSAFAQTVEVSQKSARITAEGSVVGTPAYLAPEQVRGEPVGPAADQFALATLAFELFARKLPWQGGTVLEVVASILRDAPSRASEARAEIPEAIDVALTRALAKAPADRFPSVAAFADAIEAAAVAAFGAAARSADPSSSPDVMKSALAVTAPLDEAAATTSGTGPAAYAATTEVAPQVAKLRATTGSALTRAEVVESVAAPRRRGAARWLAGGAIAVLLLGGGYAARRATSRGDGPAPSAAPNVPPPVIAEGAIVACPLFQANGDGIEGPTGWLGAAAAALTCDRIAARLGASHARALAPAELLPGMPREPVDQVPIDPFSAPEADARIRAAAKARAQVIADGTIERSPRDFGVEIVLRTTDGAEIARGHGHDVELYAAVTQAVRGAVPAGKVSSFQREWLGAETTDAALELLDLATADLAEDTLDLSRRCASVTQRSDVAPSMAFFVRDFCHEQTKRAPLPDAPPPVVHAPRSELLATVVDQGVRGGPEETKKRAALLLEEREHTESAEEGALLGSAAADLYFRTGDTSDARSAARAAVHDWPNLVDLRGSPFHRLSFSAEFDEGIAETHAIWLPFEPVAVQDAGAHAANMVEKIKLAGRAYLLGPRGFFADAYGELLARSGKTERARGIAEQNGHDLLRVQVLTAEARYKQSFELATHRILELPTKDESSRAVFRLSAAAVETSAYTGRSREFMDDVVKRFVDAEPPHVSAGFISYLDLVYACVEAPKPTAKRCVKRLRELYARGLPGAIAGSIPAVLEGADRWVAGDARGAAKAWRPLLQHPGTWFTSELRHVMVDAFDRSGMPELAARLDDDFLLMAEQPGAMDLAVVRGARRADAAGERKKAAHLADLALAKWRLADDDVPMVKEMEAIKKRGGQ